MRKADPALQERLHAVGCGGRGCQGRARLPHHGSIPPTLLAPTCACMQVHTHALVHTGAHQPGDG